MARMPAQTASKQLSRRILVSIKRDELTTSSRVIYQHELPILQSIHGEDEVQEIEPESLDAGYSEKMAPALLVHNKTQDKVAKPSTSAGIGFVFIGDPRAEYERLSEAYGRDVEKPVSNVEVVYGRYQDGRFTSMLGNPSYADLPAAQLVDIVIAAGYLPAVSHDAPREERQAAAEQERKLRASPHSELLKLATELMGEPA